MIQEFADMTADVFRLMGTSAVFTPVSGPPVNTLSIKRHNIELTDTYGTVIEVQTLVSLPRADVGLPEHGATVTVGTDTYRCDRIVGYTDHLVRISCS